MGCYRILSGTATNAPHPAQVRVEEELAWIDGSSIYRRLRATGTSLGADAGMDTEEVAETGGLAAQYSGQGRAQRCAVLLKGRRFGGGRPAGLGSHLARRLGNLGWARATTRSSLCI